MAGLLAAGCYQRVPLTTATPDPSTRIVATLTDSGVVAMSNAIGPGAMEIEGVVSSATPTQWNVQMLRVDHRDGRSVGWNREIVAFQPSTLLNTTRIQLDKRRSWLAAGGVTIGAFVIAGAFSLLGSSEEDRRQTPPPASLVPVGN
jgi:hypothetical protein